MRRVADGDRAVFSDVFRALWPLARDLCARLLGNRTEAEDAAQRALVKLFQGAAGFDPEGDVVSWALTIATWECRTLRRRARRVDELAENVRSPAHTPEDDVMRRELEAEAVRLVGALSPLDRETLAMAFAPDPSSAMASVAFRKRKERALVRLRVLWRNRHGSE